MNKTKIEWVKNPNGTQGYTWNPITGCLNNKDGLCLGGNFPCYAYKLANGRLKSRYLANTNLPTHNEPSHEAHHSDPFYPRFWDSRLFQPMNDKYISEKGIFVCDMSDLFGTGIPSEWTKSVIDVIEDCPSNRFYLLTKQPQNLIKFSPFPDNCWVGVTATDAEMAWIAIENLNRVEAKVKYISFEPLLNSIALPSWELNLSRLRCLDWVIIGAQTKPYKPPLKIWVDEITEACKRAGIPYFLKDNLRPLLGNNLIQDMPKGAEIDH